MFRLYRVAFRAGHETFSGIVRTSYDMTLHFGDRRGVASLHYINHSEVTVFVCEQKLYPYGFRTGAKATR